MRNGLPSAATPTTEELAESSHKTAIKTGVRIADCRQLFEQGILARLSVNSTLDFGCTLQEEKRQTGYVGENHVLRWGAG